MKKLVLLLVAFALSASVSFGKGRPERPKHLDKQLERIEEALKDLDPESRKAKYLENKKELLSLQKEFREEVRKAVEALGEDADREARKEAAADVRKDFADDFRAFKDSRRDAAKERRQSRKDAEGEG